MGGAGTKEQASEWWILHAKNHSAIAVYVYINARRFGKGRQNHMS